MSWKHFIEKYVLFLKEDEENLGNRYPTINLVSILLKVLFVLKLVLRSRSHSQGKPRTIEIMIFPWREMGHRATGRTDCKV